MAKALKRTTPPGPTPTTRPMLTRRRRRGLYLLADLLRGEFNMTHAMLLSHARARSAKHEHELSEALAWIDSFRRYESSRGGPGETPKGRPIEHTPPPDREI